MPRDVEIPRDTLVVIDMGARLDGYCSDCTRTFATGALGADAVEAYELVLRAQVAALAAVRAGADVSAVDGVARDIIEAAGHGERFGHGLGHGVGLEVHEAPRLGKTASGTLEAGNVVTVEPGVYLPGEFGIRIEDLGGGNRRRARGAHRLHQGPRDHRLIVLAGAAALLGALVQSATGFGFALVLSPALFAVLDPYEAITTMLLLGPPLNLLVLADSGAASAQWRVLAPMLAAAMPGLRAGRAGARAVLQVHAPGAGGGGGGGGRGLADAPPQHGRGAAPAAGHGARARAWPGCSAECSPPRSA